MAGAVEKAEGTTLTLNYKTGEKKIEVTPQTVIVTLAPGSKDDLKPGAKIVIARAMRQSNGVLTASRVSVGRGIAPPM